MSTKKTIEKLEKQVKAMVSWDYGLSVRARFCLKRANLHSREEALEYFKKNRFVPGMIPNFGKITYKEVVHFLGIQNDPLVSSCPCLSYAVELLQKNGCEVTKK